jgi:DNA mismatch repair protein MutS
MAGVPAEVVARAREVLARLEENDLTLTKSTVRASRRRKLFGDHPSLFHPQSEIRHPQSAIPPPHPILEEIRALDVGRMTPLEALSRLDAWKKRMEEGEKGEVGP